MQARPLRVYLSGSIRKGSEDTRSADHFWTPEDEAFILANGGQRIELLNPAKTDIRRQDFGLNFGCDLYLVSISDIVLVDARKERGIGIGAEMMFAVQRGIPVITWAPQETHYRRSEVPNVFGENLKDWTHPFVYGLSDYVVDSLADAVELISKASPERPLARRTDPQALIDRYAESTPDARFVPIGGGVYQDMLGGGQREEEIFGAVRYRFLDVLYLPAPTDRIDRDALVAINRWREKRIAERPLLHSDHVRHLACAVLDSLGSTRRVFEIGCGKFPLAHDIPLTSWSGLDVDAEAVRYGLANDLQVAQRPGDVKEVDLGVDAVVALFSMQFELGQETLNLLGRLPPDTILLFNLPTRDDMLVQRRLDQLSTLGFEVKILDLEATGAHDRLVLAGRLEAETHMSAAQGAALTQASLEWPALAATFHWIDAIATIAHRGNVR